MRKGVYRTNFEKYEKTREWAEILVYTSKEDYLFLNQESKSTDLKRPDGLYRFGDLTRESEWVKKKAGKGLEDFLTFGIPLNFIEGK